MPATIVANGTEILMFDDGPHFKFSPGISLFVKCKTRRRSTPTGTSSSPAAAGKTIAAAFRTSGASPRQIIPDALGCYLGDPDPEKANRVMQAMLKMKKIVVADLDRAAAA